MSEPLLAWLNRLPEVKAVLRQSHQGHATCNSGSRGQPQATSQTGAIRPNPTKSNQIRPLRMGRQSQLTTKRGFYPPAKNINFLEKRTQYYRLKIGFFKKTPRKRTHSFGGATMRSQTQSKLVKVRNRSKAEVSCYSNVNGVSYGNHIEVTPFTIADRGDARPTRPAHAGRGKPNPTKSDQIQVKNSRGISIR